MRGRIKTSPGPAAPVPKYRYIHEYRHIPDWLPETICYVLSADLGIRVHRIIIIIILLYCCCFDFFFVHPSPERRVLYYTLKELRKSSSHLYRSYCLGIRVHIYYYIMYIWYSVLSRSICIHNMIRNSIPLYYCYYIFYSCFLCARGKIKTYQ